MITNHEHGQAARDGRLGPPLIPLSNCRLAVERRCPKHLRAGATVLREESSGYVEARHGHESVHGAGEPPARQFVFNPYVFDDGRVTRTSCPAICRPFADDALAPVEGRDGCRVDRSNIAPGIRAKAGR